MEKIKATLNSRAFLILLGLVLAICIVRYIVFPKSSQFNGDETNFIGLVKNVKISKTKAQIELETDDEKLICNYYFRNGEILEFGDIPLGSEVRIEGKLKSPVNNTVPNTFNYKKYLYHKGAFYSCTVKSIEVLGDASVLYRVKNAVISRIMTYDISDYLYTLIIGDKTLLDNEVYAKYRENGVSHLFAISGMHIGLFSILLLGLLKRLNFSDVKRYSTVVAFIWFYAFLVGFSASVMRAVMLFTLGAINKLLKLELSPFRIFSIVGSILVICNPGIIFDIGFVYSFTIAGGLILSRKYLNEHKIIGTSLVATLYSIPITISNFYTINLFGVINNLLFVPLMTSIVYPLCLLTFAFRFLEPLAKMGLIAMEFLNDLASKIDFLSFVVPKMSFIVMVIYYIILVKRFEKRPIFVTVILLSIVLATKTAPLLMTDYKVDFLDVGQGDSILIRTPHSKDVILIDTGGVVSEENNYKPSENTINYLHSLGIDSLSYLIITHGDADHAGDAINIVNSLKVNKVILNCGEYNDLENELIKVLKKKEIEYDSCIEELNIDNNKLHFLNTSEYNNENDNSSVIYTELDSFKFLFMGDASSTTEKEVLNKYNLSNIDVLKVGHHGSKTSSSVDFINEINPKFALISVGKNNRYGHPNKEVLENLENSIVYRTDIDGSILFEVSDKKLKIEACPP